MNGILKIILGILAVVALFGGIFALIAYSTYSSLVSQQVDVDKSWSDVGTQYQRRADVIPRMVKIAEASMKFQTKLTIEYAQARKGLDVAGQMYRDAIANAKTPEDIEKAEAMWKDAQAQMNSVQFMINAVSESVPQANLEQMTELNNEMSAIENVISGKRQTYNNVVARYNKNVLIPPSSWFASYWGFETKQLFQAQKGAENAPNVDFNISI